MDSTDDTGKTKEQLLAELTMLRQRVAEQTTTLQGTNDQRHAEVHKHNGLERAIQDARTYAESLVETIREPLIVLDGDLRVVSANRAFYRTFGVRPEETAHHLLYDLGTHQWDIPALRTLLEDILPAHTAFEDFEVTHTFPALGQRTILLNARRLDHEDNQTQLILLAMEDITARKQAEDALRRQHDWLDVTLASIGDGVIATDPRGLITFINPVAAELTGWLGDEALGHPFGEVLRLLSEQTRQPVETPVAHVLREGVVVGLANHTVLVRRDGREIAIADSAAPIRDRAGALHGVVMVFRDVSEQQRLADELFRARKIESVGVLAGGIAHDFNNLLTSILGNISLAKLYGEADARVVQRLTEAERACQRATALTHQLLTFARGGSPVRRTVSIHELLHESVGFAVRGANVRCDVALPDALWPADIDADQINQVIHNVVLNAVQAMPEGGSVQVRAENIALTTTAALPLQEGRYIKITVRDHGEGIPADVLPTIFDPYFTTKAGGNGLGLATAYAIVTKHDGSLTVESTEGVGTTFGIYLPASQDPIDRAPEVAGVSLVGSGRVLVMDDDATIRDLLREMLTSMGYAVEYARDGAEALAVYHRLQAEGQVVAVVILDMTIPGGMGGQETLKRLRAIDPQVKALVSSGYANDPVMAHYAQYGFDGVVTKPYTIQRLHEALRRVLG
jgi:PAS domain S-box-containing protein